MQKNNDMNFQSNNEEIPDREATDVIAQFLSLVISLIAFKFSSNVSVPCFRTSLFPRHDNAYSHAYLPNGRVMKHTELTQISNRKT